MYQQRAYTQLMRKKKFSKFVRLYLVMYMLIISHTEIYFWIWQTNPYQNGAFWFGLVFTFQPIQNEIEFRFVLHRSENENYNMTPFDRNNKKPTYPSALIMWTGISLCHGTEA